MHERQNRLLVTLIAAMILAVGFGCSQPEDVIAPVSATKIIMDPEVLPTLPAGYVYELWVVDTLIEPYSLGKFIWNQYEYQAYDVDSNEIDKIWTVDYDLLNDFYLGLAVTVEMHPDDNPMMPGPIMLLDIIADPEDRPMKLAFPLDLSLGTIGFSMETPTDKNSRSKDASGVWFALYSYDSIVVKDTLSAVMVTVPNDRALEIESVYWRCLGYEGTNCTLWNNVTDSVLIDSLYPYDSTSLDTVNLEELAATLDTVGIVCLDTVIDSHWVYHPLNIDSFIHRSVVFDFVTFPVNVSADPIDTYFVNPCTDETTWLTIDPFVDFIHTINYPRIDSMSYKLDLFIANQEDLPDLYNTGWHYKGWIISPYLPQDCPELGRMTKPAWALTAKTQFDQMFPDADTCSIITTGNFKSFEHPDDGNPYSLKLRVPSFPGEDFLDSLPCGVDSVYFAIKDTVNTWRMDLRAGDVFITVEPDNFDANTNFPIFLFVTPYSTPSYRMVSDTTVNHVQNFLMQNLCSAVMDNPAGFPRIWVELVRE